MEFAAPGALWSLLSLPALLAVYFLVGRSQKRVVSSLFLFVQQKQTPSSGLKWRRLQKPLSLFLELLILTLLAMAAARPRYWAPSVKIPLAVVLDDSFSMRSGEEASPRSQAAAYLEDLVESDRYAPILLIAAGPEPRFLPSGDNIQSRLTAWRCNQIAFNGEAGIARATQAGGPSAHIVVLSDHKPPGAEEKENVHWQAFGENRENTAITAASRSPGDGSDRCLLEISHYGRRPVSSTLNVKMGDRSVQHVLDLEPGESRRLIIEAPHDAMVEAVLSEDALAYDNRAWLAPLKQPVIRVETRIGDPVLARQVFNGLKAVGAKVVVENPHILITDQPQPQPDPKDPWLLEIRAFGPTKPLLGPFVLNTRHPLTEGLSLEGVIWNAGEQSEPGTPVVTAGNRSLISERISGQHRHVRLNFSPTSSNLTQTPNWPVLLWNLMQMRADRTPGPNTTNPPLGASVMVRAQTETVAITDPLGETHQIPVHNGEAGWKTRDMGTHLATTPAGSWPFAVNALSAEESNLSQAQTGQWGGGGETGSQQRVHQDLTWLFLLIILALMACHWLFFGRGA